MSRIYSACTGKQLIASGLVTTDGKAGVLVGYSIKIGDGGGNTIVEFRDGGATGTIRWEDGRVEASDVGDVYITYAFTVPLVFSSDIYVKIASGENAEVNVVYVETED